MSGEWVYKKNFLWSFFYKPETALKIQSIKYALYNKIRVNKESLIF